MHKIGIPNNFLYIFAFFLGGSFFYLYEVFEYFGTAHPILLICAEDGVASNLVKSRNAGFVSINSKALSKQLDFWVDKKLKNSVFFNINENVRNGLPRDEQFIKLDDFLIQNNLLGKL